MEELAIARTRKNLPESRKNLPEMVRLRRQGKTFGEIAERFGMTKQRVQQLIAEVLPSNRAKEGRRAYVRSIFQVSKDLEPFLLARARDTDPAGLRNGGIFGDISKRDLRRYWALLKEELEGIFLSEIEAGYISVAVAWYEGKHDIRVNPESLLDVVEEYAESHPKTEVPRRIRTYLRQLTLAQHTAIVDACERARILSQGTVADRLRQVGLVR